MRYAITTKFGMTGTGEVVWAPGKEPLLYIDGALWTANHLVQQEVELTEVIDRRDDQEIDATARRGWENAYLRAIVDHELADAPPELRSDIEQRCRALLDEKLAGGRGGEEAAA